ncbi:MAG: NADH-quinone oxidoreductase subunit K [Candidatus Micrarchaeaceae archaeon]|jgi:NADH:ubiquinone oxidoreductase subunit K
MIFIYFVLLAMALFGIGISGVIASRHFLVMMLSIEVMFAASALLAVTFFYYVENGNIISLLLVLWSVAAVEIIAIVTFYRYMVKGEMSLDITKLSKLKN